jgi:hypothetical protein
MADGRWHGMFLVCALGMAPMAVLADAPDESAAREGEPDGQSRLEELQDFLARRFESMRPKEPEWLRKVSRDRFEAAPRAGDDALQLVVQRDRMDGAELLTLRYPLADLGALRAYAGAGVNRTVYLAESRFGPSTPVGMDRERAVGAAAEIGAEVRLSDRMMISADMRWLDLADEAVVLRTKAGPVVADELALGIAVGWRFR